MFMLNSAMVLCTIRFFALLPLENVIGIPVPANFLTANNVSVAPNSGPVIRIDLPPPDHNGTTKNATKNTTVKTHVKPTSRMIVTSVVTMSPKYSSAFSNFGEQEAAASANSGPVMRLFPVNFLPPVHVETTRKATTSPSVKPTSQNIVNSGLVPMESVLTANDVSVRPNSGPMIRLFPIDFLPPGHNGITNSATKSTLVKATMNPTTRMIVTSKVTMSQKHTSKLDPLDHVAAHSVRTNFAVHEAPSEDILIRSNSGPLIRLFAGPEDTTVKTTKSHSVKPTIRKFVTSRVTITPQYESTSDAVKVLVNSKHGLKLWAAEDSESGDGSVSGEASGSVETRGSGESSGSGDSSGSSKASEGGGGGAGSASASGAVAVATPATVKEMTVSVPYFKTDKWGDWVYNPWGVTFGKVWQDTRFGYGFRPFTIPRMHLDSYPVRNYYSEKDKFSTVCIGKSTIYNTPRVYSWMKRNVYNYTHSHRPIWITLRKELFTKGISEECHTAKYDVWRPYTECALRRNQRMEYLIPQYPLHQTAYHGHYWKP